MCWYQRKIKQLLFLVFQNHDPMEKSISFNTVHYNYFLFCNPEHVSTWILKIQVGISNQESAPRPHTAIPDKSKGFKFRIRFEFKTTRIFKNPLSAEPPPRAVPCKYCFKINHVWYLFSYSSFLFFHLYYSSCWRRGVFKSQLLREA